MEMRLNTNKYDKELKAYKKVSLQYSKALSKLANNNYMIDLFKPEVDNLDINDFEELTTYIVQAMMPAQNGKDFFQSNVYIKYINNKVFEMKVNIPYANYIEEDLFIESMGYLIPKLKLATDILISPSKYNHHVNYQGDSIIADNITLTIPYISMDNINEYIQQKSLDIINELICQVAPFISDKHNFRVTSNKILNYFNIDSTSRPNSYTLHFDYSYHFN